MLNNPPVQSSQFPVQSCKCLITLNWELWTVNQDSDKWINYGTLHFTKNMEKTFEPRYYRSSHMNWYQINICTYLELLNIIFIRCYYNVSTQLQRSIVSGMIDEHIHLPKLILQLFPSFFKYCTVLILSRNFKFSESVTGQLKIHNLIYGRNYWLFFRVIHRK